MTKMALALNSLLILVKRAQLSIVIHSQRLKNSNNSCSASSKITFACQWTCHAHEKESFDSLCV